jgi:hypothetical protein
MRIAALLLLLSGKPISEPSVVPGPFVMNIPGEPSEAADLVTPVLRKVLDFMGIRIVDVVRAGGSLAVNFGKVRLGDHLAKYDAEIAAAAKV